MTYLIAWTEYFNNTITIKSYEAENPLEAVKLCWKERMFPQNESGFPEEFFNKLKEQYKNFSSVEEIQNDFFDCDENISYPIAIDEFLTK